MAPGERFNRLATSLSVWLSAVRASIQSISSFVVARLVRLHVCFAGARAVVSDLGVILARA
jgi:hypothetical protein